MSSHVWCWRPPGKSWIRHWPSRDGSRITPWGRENHAFCEIFLKDPRQFFLCIQINKTLEKGNLTKFVESWLNYWMISWIPVTSTLAISLLSCYYSKYKEKPGINYGEIKISKSLSCKRVNFAYDKKILHHIHSAPITCILRSSDWDWDSCLRLR